MHGLKHSMLIAKICARCNSHAALKHAGKVGANISKHIGCNDHIEPLRVSNCPHAKCVDVRVIRLYFGILFCNFMVDSIEQLATARDIRFVHTGDAGGTITWTSVATASGFERISEDTFASVSRDGARVPSNFAFKAGKFHRTWIPTFPALGLVCRPAKE